MRQILITSTITTFVALSAIPASAQQQWLLNPTASRFVMQTVKNNAVFENHRFSGLDGTISRTGDATVKIDLISVKSGIDVRDVRMRFLLFETFRFPEAVITAKLDMNKLQELASTTRVTYPLKAVLDLHGITRDFDTQVTITRLSDKTVAVATVEPIIVTAESHKLAEGIGKLSEAVGGIPIAAGASFTFDLVFETGERIAVIEAARQEAVRQRTEEETSQISTEACQTRFSVISTTQAIYFKTASADLDNGSEPMLNSVAEIANRCPAARFQVTGHTDSVGSKESNRSLSEQRAKAVVNYLARRGVEANRIESVGYGDAKPVASNDSEANRAKNRRIEFSLKAK
ncbi:MAG: OmpA-OmpF porin, family [Variibacter sp.]|jgi:outer membrane protein OmpA-like peptidoglycan-associated protein/polyisoprenoid-binding protein YceI|nr:OmpA-OmpF porin, family [Variibacter sp.]